MKKEEKLSPIVVVGMPVIAIIASFVSHIHIPILNSYINVSVFFYPLLMLFLGLIVKKENCSKAISLLAVTLLIQSLTFVLKWVLLDIMDYYLMIYTFLSTLFCGAIFVLAYEFLRKMKIDTYVPMFIVIAAITLVDNEMFSLLIKENFINVSILVRLIYAVVIPVFLAKNATKITTEKKVKKTTKKETKSTTEK